MKNPLGGSGFETPQLWFCCSRAMIQKQVTPEIGLGSKLQYGDV